MDPVNRLVFNIDKRFLFKEHISAVWNPVNILVFNIDKRLLYIEHISVVGNPVNILVFNMDSFMDSDNSYFMKLLCTLLFLLTSS